ncbi:hypothetical protein B7468_00005 [Staphylococcus lugdunensis]|nr:hypothetical protein B7468_00005 [Staphylococcus lugdunensis]
MKIYRHLNNLITMKQVGVGPQQREMRKAFRQAKQVGVLRRHPRKAKPFNTKYCENREQQQDIF